LVSQVTQNGELNMVLGKTLCVLGHAELFEPFCNLMHWRPPRIYRYPFWTGTAESLPQAPTYCALPFFLYFEREIDDVVPKQRILGLKQRQVVKATCSSTAPRQLWPVWKRHHIIGLVIDSLISSLLLAPFEWS
jgi:hypothetical protein